MERNDWSAEQVETLRKHRSDGLSAGQIARIIGRSRNAVLGKVSRLRLDKLDTHKCQWPNGAQKRKRKPTPPKHKAVELEPLLPEIEFLLDGQRVTILTLTDRMCHFPIGDGADMYFCAHGVKPGSRYCHTHWRRCVDQPKTAISRKAGQRPEIAMKQFQGRF